jgi:hypothetical protein
MDGDLGRPPGFVFGNARISFWQVLRAKAKRVEEVKQFVAERKEAGSRLDPATAEVISRIAEPSDPYGWRTVYCSTSVKNTVVRNPGFLLALRGSMDGLRSTTCQKRP